MNELKQIEEVKFDDIFHSNVFETKEFQAIKLPKIEIAKSIRDALDSKKLSLRKVSKMINDMNMVNYKVSYTQIARVTSCENYNINTLLKILDVLDLEVIIKPKQSNRDI